MQNLAKGFTKSRAYGGFSNLHCKNYLRRCRVWLKFADNELPDPDSTGMTGDEDEVPSEPSKACPRCEVPLVCIQSSRRRSWRDLLADYAIRPLWYQPLPRPSFDARHRIRAPEP